MKKIYAINENFVDHSDAGITFEAQCPKCNCTIRVAPHAWWETKCTCGLEWNIEIDIYAKTEEGD